MPSPNAFVRQRAELRIEADHPAEGRVGPKRNWLFAVQVSNRNRPRTKDDLLLRPKSPRDLPRVFLQNRRLSIPEVPGFERIPIYSLFAFKQQIELLTQ